MTAITLSKEDLAAAIATGVAQALQTVQKEGSTDWEDEFAALIGKTVFIRTVTMTNVGVLAAVTRTSYILESGAVWISNTGSWSTFCNKGVADDVEPFGPYPVYVSKGGVIDVAEMPCIPKKKK